MKISKRQLLCTMLVLLFIAGTLPGPAAPSPAAASDWQIILQQRLPLYGHRNWIVVTDSAFPAYTQAGIETIFVNQDLPTVLNDVAKSIAASKHVRATAFVDKELPFVEEKDYPGIAQLKQEIHRTLEKSNASSIPHAEAISKIDEASKMFRVLIIKTNTTIPFTSVFLRLDCGYLTDEVDAKIKNAMASASK